MGALITQSGNPDNADDNANVVFTHLLVAVLYCKMWLLDTDVIVTLLRNDNVLASFELIHFEELESYFNTCVFVAPTILNNDKKNYRSARVC